MALPGPFRVGDRNGGQEPLGVWVQGVAVQLPAGAYLYKMAQVHDADMVGNMFDHGEVMGYEQIGYPQFLLDILQKVDDLRLDGHVKS